jgi:hypothetical protein
MNLSTSAIEKKVIVIYVTAYLISFAKTVVATIKKAGYVQIIGNNI